MGVIVDFRKATHLPSLPTWHVLLYRQFPCLIVMKITGLTSLTAVGQSDIVCRRCVGGFPAAREVVALGYPPPCCRPPPITFHFHSFLASGLLLAVVLPGVEATPVLPSPPNYPVAAEHSLLCRVWAGVSASALLPVHV
jgi:hypothetical protein